MTLPATGSLRLLLIVHPKAGGGRGARALPEVVRALRAGGADVVSELTRDIDHAGALAEHAVERERIAVAFGGDGLAGRVAGVCATRGGAFAALPGGRGNDFLRGLGVGSDPVAAARALPSWTERRVDIGRVTGPDGVPRPYLGIASVGFDSDVQVTANRTKLIRGASVYTYAALRTLAGWRPATFTVTTVTGDGGGAPAEHTTRVVGWSVAAANAAYYGGGMKYAPSARIDDGLLELIVAERSSKLHFLAMLPKVFSGAHVQDPRIRVSRVRRVVVDADRDFQVYADGDPLADLPATIEVMPGALRLLCPNSSNFGQ
jgi:YegS/Rv2252/BmrU family lipid kinase